RSRFLQVEAVDTHDVGVIRMLPGTRRAVIAASAARQSEQDREGWSSRVHHYSSWGGFVAIGEPNLGSDLPWLFSGLAMADDERGAIARDREAWSRLPGSRRALPNLWPAHADEDQ